MATFSTNQVRQLYVATALAKSPTFASDAVGSIVVKADATKTHLYFEYKGVDNLMRSDLISIKDILYAKATEAEKMATNIKSVTVTLDKTVNEGKPVVGQDYNLRITFRQYVGMSDEDTNFRYGSTHVYSGMDADKFYKTLALSIAENSSRDVVPLIKVEVHSTTIKNAGGFDAKGYMVVTPTTKDNGANNNTNPYWIKDTEITKDIDHIRISEVEQPWRLGVMAQTPVYFTVNPVPVIVEGDERIWATVTEETNGTINNGKKIADLEYFCMGERGDIYRGIGFPNNIVTSYLVDPSKAYHTLDIHYAYVGDNESAQKSEKDITIVCSDNTQFKQIVADFNIATGLNIKTTL